MMVTKPNQLLFLGFMGLTLLWGVAFKNGMFDNLDVVLSSARMPDGRELRTKYSGNWFLDDRFTLLSAFYEMLTNGLSSGPRLLFFDVNYVVACTNVWSLIESRRRGTTNWFMRLPAIAMIFWNATGAAIIQPFYFYALVKSKASIRDPTIPVNEATALLALAPIVMAFPLLLFAPAWLNYSTWEHHGYIAMFQTAPIIGFIIFLSIVVLLSPKYGLTSAKNPAKPNEDKTRIVSTYILAGTIAALVHIYTLIASYKTKNVDATLSRLFVPSLEVTRPYTTWYNSNTTTLPSLPPKYVALLEEYHLFTQFDWIVVTLECIVFVHLLMSLRAGEDTEKKASKIMSDQEWLDLACLTVGSVIIGPGAAGSFALAVRESRVRDAHAKAQHT